MTAQGEDILAFLDRAITAAEQNANRWHDTECDVHAMGITDVADLFMAAQVPGAVCDCTGPASVLRRCAADRKLVALHAVVPNHGRFTEGECPADCDGAHSGPSVCFSCRTYVGDPVEAPCATLRVLAEGYGWTEDPR